QRTGKQFHIRRARGAAGHEEHLDLRLKLNHLMVGPRRPGTTTSLTRTAILPGTSLARARASCEENSSRTMKPDSRRNSPKARPRTVSSSASKIVALSPRAEAV